MRETLRKYCEETNKLGILEEWDIKGNLPLTPDNVSYGSKSKVLWKCDKGHSWKSAVYARTGCETRCPVCAGKLPVAGINDLQTIHPELAQQWHPTLNGELKPTQVRPGSHKAVWWICNKGHAWRASVNSRNQGTGCPVCTKRKIVVGDNDLQATHPELAMQWDAERNGEITPNEVTSGSHHKVWWLCDKGHSWRASISARAAGSGCPICAGKVVLPGYNDLETEFPSIAAQWHPTKNGVLSPKNISPYSNRKVWWQCDLGHSYQAIVGSRTHRGNGCPYCSGRKVLPGFNDLATVAPAIAAQWHPTLNGKLTPQDITAGAHHKVWWKCSEGHVWRSVVYSRTSSKKCGCPICSGRVKMTRYSRIFNSTLRV